MGIGRFWECKHSVKLEFRIWGFTALLHLKFRSLSWAVSGAAVVRTDSDRIQLRSVVKFLTTARLTGLTFAEARKRLNMPQP